MGLGRGSFVCYYFDFQGGVSLWPASWQTGCGGGQYPTKLGALAFRGATFCLFVDETISGWVLFIDVFLVA
jgi:hypothetical protein